MNSVERMMLKMKTILGIDPGRNTGLCILKGSEVISYTTIEHISVAILQGWVKKQEADIDLIVVEAVVTTGKLNLDKAQQIMAYTVAVEYANLNKIACAILHPELRKQLGSKIVLGVKGDHAKDAYRIVQAHLARSRPITSVEG